MFGDTMWGKKKVMNTPIKEIEMNMHEIEYMLCGLRLTEPEFNRLVGKLEEIRVRMTLARLQEKEDKT